ncbi:hypothetical protein [Streptomyces sp. NPDC050982]|uniref:hypothetical protein n=1 Tax=Streptomyces sp. NPDC050982 TaxID=3154746 RepID=UPI0033D843F2
MIGNAEVLEKDTTKEAGDLPGAVPGRPGRWRSGRAHFVAFDLLRLSGTDTTGWS